MTPLVYVPDLDLHINFTLPFLETRCPPLCGCQPPTASKPRRTSRQRPERTVGDWTRRVISRQPRRRAAPSLPCP